MGGERQGGKGSVRTIDNTTTNVDAAAATQYHALPPSYPNVSIAQAVNSMYMGENGMYLPSSPAPPPYTSSPGDSLLEITELEDAPPTRDYTVYLTTPAYWSCRQAFIEIQHRNLRKYT